MIDLDLFRQDLATLMRTVAADRRRASAGGLPSGEDLKIIALFERLAGEATACGAEAHTIARDRLRGEPLGRCLRRHRALLGMVGSMVWPASVEELVRWMADQISPESDTSLDAVPPIRRPAWRWAATAFGPLHAPPVIGA